MRIQVAARKKVATKIGKTSKNEIKTPVFNMGVLILVLNYFIFTNFLLPT